MQDYYIPSDDKEVLLEVKKSRFIARGYYVENREQVNEYLEIVKQDYPDARHYCWAYILGHPKSAISAAMSDDGEPSGTAGKPIYNVLSHKDVGFILVIVIRYFGGIKLGAGGLVRAYSAVAQKLLDNLPVTLVIQYEVGRIYCDYSEEQKIRHQLNVINGRINDVTYQEQVELYCQIPQERKDEFLEWLMANSLQWLEGKT